MNKELSVNQASLIICICSISLKISALPGYMSSFMGGDFWLATMLVFLIEIISFALIIQMAKKEKDKTFFQIIENKFGKVITKIVELIFLIFFILKTILVIYETEIFIKRTIYEDFNEWLFLIVFVMFLIYASSKDFTTHGRVSELIIYLVIGGGIISLMLSLLEVDLTNVLPLFKNGFFPFYEGISKTTFWFGDYLIFLLMMGNIKYEKNTTKKFIKTYTISSIFIIVLYIAFSCLYKNTTAIHLTAISEVSHYIPRLNDFRLDWISDIMWIIVQIFTCSIWVYLVKISFIRFSGIKNRNIIILIIFGLIILFIFNILDLPIVKYMSFLGDYMGWLVLLLTQTPLLLFLALKNKKEKAKNAT